MRPTFEFSLVRRPQAEARWLERRLGCLLAPEPVGLANLPCPAAVDALRLVHAKQRATTGAGPFDRFLCHELLDPNGFDSLQVFNDADTVLGSVAAIEVYQISAGELGTGNTELMVARCKLFAVLDCTGQASVRLVGVAASATWTWLALSNVCAAQTAIDPARCNKQRGVCLNLRTHI